MARSTDSDMTKPSDTVWPQKCTKNASPAAGYILRAHRRRENRDRRRILVTFCGHENHSLRSASTGLSRAARQAGISPASVDARIEKTTIMTTSLVAV